MMETNAHDPLQAMHPAPETWPSGAPRWHAEVFTDTTQVHIPGDVVQRKIGTASMIVRVYTPPPMARPIEPDLVTIDPTTLDVRVRWVDHDRWQGSLVLEPTARWPRRLYVYARRWLARHGWLRIPGRWTHVPAVPHSGVVILQAFA